MGSSERGSSWVAHCVVAVRLGTSLLAGCDTEAPSDTGDAGGRTPWPLGCATYADRDGDGVSRTDRSQCTQLDDDARTSPASGKEDCDDTDPARSYGQQFYTDEDGDGFGVPRVRSVWGCRGDVIEGFAPNVTDCNDDDASLQLLLPHDRDGDGHGAGPAECVAHDAPGFAPEGDCDDEDPTVFPGLTPELPLDGTDSNCDGDDYPYLSVPITDDDGAVSEPSLFPIPDSTRCQGRGPSILAVEENYDCGGGFRLQIANRGSESISDGRITLTRIIIGTRGREDSFLDPFTVELPELPSGTVVRTEIFSGGPHLAQLATDADLGDCPDLSSMGRVGGPFVDCF